MKLPKIFIIIFCTPCRTRTYNDFSPHPKCGAYTNSANGASVPLRGVEPLWIKSEGFYCLFLFLKLSVWLWQLGHNICKFSNLLSVMSPFIWWSSHIIGLPLHSEIPHISHLFSLILLLNNLSFTLDELSELFVSNIADRGAPTFPKLGWPNLFHPCPVKWETSIPYFIILFFKVL